MTPFYKKWWFIVIIAVIIIGAGTSAMGKNNSTGTGSEDTQKLTSTESGSASTESKTSEVASKKSYRIGDVVEVGDLTYTVHSKELVQTIGKEPLDKKANGVFLVLDLTVKNNGKKAVNVTDNFFKLRKGDVEFESDSTAGLYANSDGKFFYTDLNPESTLKGKVVFDLSEETAQATGLVLQVQTGFWGTEKEVILLD